MTGGGTGITLASLLVASLFFFAFFLSFFFSSNCSHVRSSLGMSKRHSSISSSRTVIGFSAVKEVGGEGV